MAGDWFYVPNDRATELGPFSQEQLQDLLASGEIGPDTMIRKRSWMDWQKAGTIDLLTTAPKPPDSAYPEQGHAGNTDPVVVPNSRRKPRRTILVVVSVVAAVLVVAVAVEVRTGGNGPPANESAQSFRRRRPQRIKPARSVGMDSLLPPKERSQCRRPRQCPQVPNRRMRAA